MEFHGIGRDISDSSLFMVRVLIFLVRTSMFSKNFHFATNPRPHLVQLNDAAWY